MSDPTINQLRTAAYDFRSSIDVPQQNFDRMGAKQYYTDFLRFKIKNPTRANIAMEEMYREYPCKYPMSYEQNLKILEKSPKVDTLIKKADRTTKELYPKTGGLRKRLISARGINFDEIKPVLKGLKKQLLKMYIAF